MNASTLARLASRSLRRHRARTGLTGGAIFGGVFVVLGLSALIDGFGQLTRNDLVLGRSGALQVHRAGYGAMRDAPPLDLDLPESGPLLASMRAVPGVTAVAPRLVFSALLHVGDQSRMCQVRGIDPAREAQVLPWRPRRPAARAHGDVWLGDRLAARLHVTAGADAVLEATGPSGQIEARDVGIAGIFVGSEVESVQVAELPLAEAQLLVHMPGRVSGFLLAVDPAAPLAAVRAQLVARLGPGYEVVSWTEIDPNIVDVIDLLQRIVDAVGVISLVIVSFGIVNAMRMSVYERTREIGTMLAIGARRRSIGAMFVLEAGVLASMAIALATLLAAAATAAIAASGGILIAPPGEAMVSYPLVPTLRPASVAVTAAAALVGAVAAALYPALRAASLRPVEALQAP